MDLTPSFPSSFTAESWAAAGLDPARQATKWILPDENQLNVIVKVLGQGFYSHRRGQQSVWDQPSLRPCFPYTEGMALEPFRGFVRVNHWFALLPLFEAFLPQGEYKFRIDFTIIPKSLAHPCGGGYSEMACYRNVHLSEGTGFRPRPSK